MFWKIFLLSLMMVVFEGAYGNSLAQTTFETQVYPHLVRRCSSCHGEDQFPLHASEDVKMSYLQALKTINLNFPEESSLWIRSYNNHCGKALRCGVVDMELKQGIHEWAQLEKSEKTPEELGYQYIQSTLFDLSSLDFDRSDRDVWNHIRKNDGNGMSMSPTSKLRLAKTSSEGQRVAFESEDGERYSFLVHRLSPSYVYLSQPTIVFTQKFLSLEGLDIRASKAIVRQQNFRDLKFLGRSTLSPVNLSPNGSGYILLYLPDQSLKSLKLDFFVKNRKLNLTEKEARAFFAKGFPMPKKQMILRPKVISLASGEYHTCATLENFQIRCWGFGAHGILGTGNLEDIGDDVDDEISNVAAELLDVSKVKASFSGGYHMCSLFLTKGIKCWGFGPQGALGYENSQSYGESLAPLPFVDLQSRKVKSVALGAQHSCVLTESGEVFCWGRGFDGQLGKGDTDSLGNRPGTMGGLLKPLNFGGPEAVHLAAGENHNCVILKNRDIKCWGSGAFGKLGNGQKKTIGDGPNEMGKALTAVPLGPDKVQSLHLGESNSCALFKNGKVKCWGRAKTGVVGQGSFHIDVGDKPGGMGGLLPYIDLGGEPVVSMDLMGRHACAVFKNGKLKCWGVGYSGQLGLGSTETRGDDAGEMGENLPFLDFGEEKVKSVSVGGDHTCALFGRGTVRCWGSNNRGQAASSIYGPYGKTPELSNKNIPTLNLGQTYHFD